MVAQGCRLWQHPPFSFMATFCRSTDTPHVGFRGDSFKILFHRTASPESHIIKASILSLPPLRLAQEQ